MDKTSRPQRITSLDTPDQEAMIIDALPLHQYHEICCLYLTRYQTINIPTNMTVNVGPVLACSQSDQPEASSEIAFLPDVDVNVTRWGVPGGAQGEIMENGWTRYFILFV
jgi:hypothetical protein